MPEPLSNADIADRFDLMADLLELEGAVVYRVLAYRRAAKTLHETPESVERLSLQGKLTSLPGIGQTIADKVAELIETGEISALDQARGAKPARRGGGDADPGGGAEDGPRIFAELDLQTVGDVRQAALEQRVRALPGLGIKTETAILEGLSAPERSSRRRALGCPPIAAGRARPVGAAGLPGGGAVRDRREPAPVRRDGQGHRHRRGRHQPRRPRPRPSPTRSGWRKWRLAARRE